MGVYLQIKDYSAMQGPAPDGFHVPLTTEWQAVYYIWTALGGSSSAGTGFGIALKLPLAGTRSYSSAGVDSQGTLGFYWSSSRYDTNRADDLVFSSTNINHLNVANRAYGFSVRGFKNSPVVPTSSWTKLYGTSIESGGIFWSNTDGLISLSSDGNTWITIMDKNLGATTVWNSGDTLSEANCGKYYQRGNNYGFPRTGSVTTSSTQVNASTYGPGNYYSSSTFITRNSSPYRWDTTDNGNLRGGVTGVKPMSELKNAYIGEYVEPGIYHNATLGLISLSSDGQNWITIADKNLGATQVYNDGDTLSEANCGKYYQRGNNYGFTWTGTITPSTTLVNANNYGPGNYYSSSTFINSTSSPYDRSSVQNDNLRGGVTGTNEAMKGPCNSGYHVPTHTEFANLINLLNTIGIDISTGASLLTYLKMSYAGYRLRTGAVSQQGTEGHYWCCDASSNYAYGQVYQVSSISVTTGYARCSGFSIRPFANAPTKPDGSRTKLY